jgi:hypothetical protein
MDHKTLTHAAGGFDFEAARLLYLLSEQVSFELSPIRFNSYCAEQRRHAGGS